MISDQETNFIYFSSKLKEKFPQSYMRITRNLDSFNINHDLIENTKDIWARDYMPIQVSRDKFIEYRYDPDYLQSVEDRSLKTYPDLVCQDMSYNMVKTNIRMDGGNVVKHNNIAILTDKIVHENADQYNKEELRLELQRLFEVQHVLFIPWDQGCIYGHSDGMLRFKNKSKVLISGFYKDADPRLWKKMEAELNKANLDFVWLDFKNQLDPEYTISYINFLQTRDILLVPALNAKYDGKAIERLSEYFPDYAERNRIIPVEIKEITRKGGALNCISWTILE